MATNLFEGLLKPQYDYANLGVNKTPSSAKPPSGNSYSSAGAFADATNAANNANELRYQQGLGLWDKIVSAYAPGGSFGQGAMASYQQGMNKAESSYAQNMVSSGLYDSTTMAGYGGRYEQEVGTPFRLNLADEQTRGYTQGLQGAANFISSKNEQAPNPELMANLTKGAARAPTGYSSPDMGGGYTPQKPSTQTTDSGYWQGSGANSPSSYTPTFDAGGDTMYGSGYGQGEAPMTYAGYGGENYGNTDQALFTSPDQLANMSTDEVNKWFDDTYNF
jgi:hypothetical protein